MVIVLEEMLGPYVAPLALHVLGDYVVQSDWMATNKTKSWSPAIAHALTYTFMFMVVAPSWTALAFIFATHVAIDHWRLARYVCWIKNHLAPRSHWPRPWRECSATGCNPDTPPFMAVWLMVIVDNLAHVLCNAFALRYL